MSLLTSLPDRPLSAAAVAALNRADAVELAVAVDDDDPADGLLLATDAWVKGLAFDGAGWSVVETVGVDGADDRYDALRACETAVRAERDGDDTDASDDPSRDADPDGDASDDPANDADR
ncbi:hypothetical protein [Candidatus Halobonum tyrrellensis]|uniref:DUF7964 domain-containing protein n=1 Tax=Candidatus Halobonum tyrrellensis G22 TaxID=1324957 RepID=V4HKZ7_9EURY|nr:hypothetical protein [Candidatus Halobonum tyrrellensis]ESP88599.1 hypothetical protein K933_09067 [Candidatus Halobonum tyrrellensis G22]